MEKTICMGHRGASFHAPQNTAASMKKAVEFGIAGIETDVHLTKDGVPVINHNYTIDANSDGHGYISRMTYEELLTYDFGAWKGTEFAGERILTLAQLLDLVKDMQVINIELKSPVKKDTPFVRTVLQTVEEAGLAEKVIFSSFDADLLHQVKTASEKYRVGLLTFAEAGSSMMREMVPTMLAMSSIPQAEQYLDCFSFPDRTLPELVDSLPYKPDYLHPDYHSVLMNPALVGEMHRRGIGVNPWTCDRAEEMQALIAAGCDGIITNRPDIFLEVTHG